MSALREHIEEIRRYKAERDAGSNSGQRNYQSAIYLMGQAHLEEIAALLDSVSAPAKCQAFDVGIAKQCDHCCLMDTEPLNCPHTAPTKAEGASK